MSQNSETMTVKEAILNLFKGKQNRSGLNVSEVQELYYGNPYLRSVPFSTLRGRVSELVSEGVLVKTDKKRPSLYNNAPTPVYKRAPKAKRS